MPPTFLFLFLMSCAKIPNTQDEATRGLKDNFHGVLLVDRKGQNVFYERFGPMLSSANRYRLGSISKTFVSAAIAQLIDKGLLNYNDNINRFFPALKYSKEISIKQLIEHKSGITDFSGEEWMNLLSKSIRKEEIIDIAVNKAMNCRPDGHKNYSNINYILAGRIVEIVSGKDLVDYLRESIFLPLAMNSTDYAESDSQIPHLAAGECINCGIENKKGSMNYSMLYYSGGYYSTLDDMRRWCKEFSNPKVLPGWYVDNPLGWEMKEKFGHLVQYHFGNLPAYSALTLIVRDEIESYYIVLSNQGNTDMNPSIRMIAEYFFREKIKAM